MEEKVIYKVLVKRFPFKKKIMKLSQGPERNPN
jgi:hypothetical protein